LDDALIRENRENNRGVILRKLQACNLFVSRIEGTDVGSSVDALDLEGELRVSKPIPGPLDGCGRVISVSRAWGSTTSPAAKRPRRKNLSTRASTSARIGARCLQLFGRLARSRRCRRRRIADRNTVSPALSAVERVGFGEVPPHRKDGGLRNISAKNFDEDWTVYIGTSKSVLASTRICWQRRYDSHRVEIGIEQSGRDRVLRYLREITYPASVAHPAAVGLYGQLVPFASYPRSASSRSAGSTSLLTRAESGGGTHSFVQINDAPLPKGPVSQSAISAPGSGVRQRAHHLHCSLVHVTEAVDAAVAEVTARGIERMRPVAAMVSGCAQLCASPGGAQPNASIHIQTMGLNPS